jgi:hypothetical protein
MQESSPPPDPFRDFGLLPTANAPPTKVRAYFGVGRVIGQFLGTAVFAAIGAGLITLFSFVFPFPNNLIAGIGIAALIGGLIFKVTQHDYTWVELDGDTIRAKHLYTRVVTERRVADIEELETVVLPLKTLAVALTEAWLGRIKAVNIRFKDGKHFPIYRADPAMTNAKELIEAVMYRMSQIGEIDAEMWDFEGSPMVARVYWKEKEE